jgi:hypothetical protein
MNNFVDTLVGAVIGTIVSFVMSWYFYKKADFPARVMGEMTENVLAMFIQSRLGQNFEFDEQVSKNQLPKDQDTPHIIHFWHTAEKLQQGGSAWILFRVEDTGLNFDGAKYVEVTETSSEIRFPVSREGHAYYSCKVNFPDNAIVGQHTVTLKLTDSKGKSYTQSLKFDVTPRSS